MPRKRSLNAKKITSMKRMIASGDHTQDEIAARFKCSRGLVSDVARERRYGDVPWPDGKPQAKKSGGQRKQAPKYDPTDERIQELEAEVALLKDERDFERKKVKANTKTAGLFRAMADELPDRIAPMKPLPKVRPRFNRKGKIEEHAVMHMSDGHLDQIVRPSECGGLETFNFPIGCCRGERYVDTTLQWTQDTLGSAFRFPVLNILNYGDHTSGEIHGAAQRSYYRRMMKNCLAIGQLHALMYRDLAPYFEQVNIVYVPGNHGRRTAKKDFHGAHDNWDYLIAKVAELHCMDMGNVSFLIPDAWSVNLDINGVGFNIGHGDDVRSQMGIPWYGLQRRQTRRQSLEHMMSGPRVRYYCVGHFHQKAVVGSGDAETIMNGAWVGTDAYVYEEFSGYTPPFQWLHGVNPKYGVSWRMDVQLKDVARESRGPQRYLIDVE